MDSDTFIKGLESRIKNSILEYDNYITEVDSEDENTRKYAEWQVAKHATTIDLLHYVKGEFIRSLK